MDASSTRNRGRKLLLNGLALGGLFLLVIGAAAYLLTQTAVPPVGWRTPGFGPLVPAATPAARWQQDLAYLARELPRLHVNAFHTTDRATFDQAVTELDAWLSTWAAAQSAPAADGLGLDDSVIVRLLALVALVGDGHTQLLVDAPAAGAPGLDPGWTMYGIAVAPLAEGWMVTGAQPEYADLIGAQVTALAGVPIEEVAAAVTPLVAADNAAQIAAGAPHWMMTPQVLAALGVVTTTTQAEFTLQLAEGSSITRTIAAVDPAARQAEFVRLADVVPAAAHRLALQQPDAWYWYTLLPDSQALYFQYDRCAEMPGQPFAPFVAEMMAAADAAEVSRVVVDLRANGGGNSAVLRPFLAALAARPALPVYVLIGRNTFSSALMNAIELDQQAGAVLVGEPTGGRPNHYGEVRSFTLPNSGLRVTYATRYFRMLAEADPPTLAPEIDAPLTIADQRTGRDAALEAALAAP